MPTEEGGIVAESDLASSLPLPNPDELEEASEQLDYNNSGGQANDEAPCTSNFVFYENVYRLTL